VLAAAESVVDSLKREVKVRLSCCVGHAEKDTQLELKRALRACHRGADASSAAWIRKTIKKVTIVVPVLITSCQVSEKPNIEPVIAHIVA
jgi:hypothetical protein